MYHPSYKCNTQKLLQDLKDTKMNNTEKTEPHNKATRTMTDATMLLLLRRPFRDAATFCAFDKIREPTTAEQRRWENYRFAEELLYRGIIVLSIFDDSAVFSTFTVDL